MYCAITIEGIDMTKEEMWQCVDRMVRASGTDRHEFRLRVFQNVERPVVISEDRYIESERALGLIYGIKNF